MKNNKANIFSYLTDHAFASPDKTVFIILENEGEGERKITYVGLEARVNKLAFQLEGKEMKGQRVLLIYKDILEFIISFLACQRSGIIPVPVPYVTGGKQFSRLMSIIDDAQAVAALCTLSSEPHLQRSLQNFPQSQTMTLLSTDPADYWPELLPSEQTEYNPIAFIQYTSGSTGMPKGVVVSGSGLLHNQQLISDTFGCNENSVIFSWLPFHHDMGLIGNILHTIYVGATGILMSPYHFMQRPKRWLECISKYRVTHSGGPNFSYDLCVERVPKSESAKLDLSCWKVAYNGSEPIRAETIQRFSDHFSSSGFRRESFFPCYGLAEATLLVSGHKHTEDLLVIFIDKRVSLNGRISLVDKADPNAKALVGCGQTAAGMNVKIIERQNGQECGELQEGEIHISGKSVTKGYWNRTGKDNFFMIETEPFFNTGDLGFFYKNQIFISGRIREMLVIRGRNVFPYDIEEKVAECDISIEANGVAVFGIDEPEAAFVIIVEIKRRFLQHIDAGTIIGAIDRSVRGLFGIDPYDIVLTTPLGIPRTTSGKLQRVKCRKEYLSMNIKAIESKTGLHEKPANGEKGVQLPATVLNKADYTTIKPYLINLIESKLGNLPAYLMQDDIELTAMGIDSIRAMELINNINRDLDINLDAAKIFGDNTLSKLINTIENMLWLQQEQTSGKEITI